MPDDKYMNYLVSPVLTQPGADTDVAVVQPTGCNVAARLAMLIHEIETELPPPRIADGAWTQIYVVSRSTLPDIVATGTMPWEVLVYSREQNCKLSGAAGVSITDMYHVRKFDPPLLYARKNITWMLRSHLTTDANAAKGRIGFTWIKLKDADYMEAVENFEG